MRRTGVYWIDLHTNEGLEMRNRLGIAQALALAALGLVLLAWWSGSRALQIVGMVLSLVALILTSVELRRLKRGYWSGFIATWFVASSWSAGYGSPRRPLTAAADGS